MIRTVKRTRALSVPRFFRGVRRRPPRSGVVRLPRIGRTGGTARAEKMPPAGRRLFLLAFVYIAGLLVGALMVRMGGGGLFQSLENSFLAYVEGRQSQPFWMTLLNAFAAALPFFAGAFFCGVCILGVPGAFLIPCFKGLGLGLTVGYVYAVYGMQGMAFCALLLIPPALASAMALLLACRESWGFSLMLFRGLLPGAGPLALRGDFKIYCLRYLFILGILLAASILDAGLSAAFIRFFAFGDL